MFEPKFLQKSKILRIKNYFRYHHFNTNPVKASHEKYVRLLTDIKVVSFEGSDREVWEQILERINSLSWDEIEDIHRKIEEKINPFSK